MNFRKLYRWVFCLRGKHERSHARVHKEGDVFFSRCSYCGVRMRRLGKRDWVVDRGKRGN